MLVLNNLIHCLMASEEGDFLSDLECGGTTTTSEEEESRDLVPLSSANRGRKALTRGRSGVLNYNGSISGDSDTDTSDSFSKSGDVSGRRVELLIERTSGGEESRDLVALLDKRNLREQRKKPSLKKASKPPRPPKGPLLNAADLKLVRELSELAARKRARIERMKASRKMKETKKTSSSSSMTAMVITILFFLVMIFQDYQSSTHL